VNRRSRRTGFARVGPAAIATLVFAACAGRSPGPHAQSADRPLSVTNAGPAPEVFVYRPEPRGSHPLRPPTGQNGIRVGSVEPGENAARSCPPRARPPSRPAAPDRADYACSG
jgi:hypothetical protein